MIPASMCTAKSEIWRRWHYSVGVFSWNGLSLLVLLHENINTEGYKDILSRCILSMVEDQFGDDDYLYQHDSALCQKSRFVREWFVDNKVPEMDWPA
jgi:hypothetical protein